MSTFPRTPADPGASVKALLEAIAPPPTKRVTRLSPRHLSGFEVGMIVALVRRLSALCTGQGISLTVTVTPESAAVRFDKGPAPQHDAARLGPDGWQYLDIEGEPVSLSWMQS